jgi:hypothetical protein
MLNVRKLVGAKAMQDNRIFVTDRAGFLGSHLRDGLIGVLQPRETVSYFRSILTN